ncbi:hypothetical protein H2200_005317 [Cladophialophora chaetospira]|uniref:RZ-type domain-containing protein n=1 Tax=Cladophialophora chaetospira TaxID=386627 RepID=A0AA38XBR0_9EURO|nr:hypothetical protein H2200_005317 [Cladophialophora chaetospira]
MPPPLLSQTCASEDTKSLVVDLLSMDEFKDINLDENPCLIPPCGHILTIESIDGQMEMSKHYSIENGIVMSITDSAVPFSEEELKVCSSCRGPLRTISRYGRIVRRALIDDATKKFIVSANQQLLPLYQAVHQQADDLIKTVKDVKPVENTPDGQDVVLSGEVDKQIVIVIQVATAARIERYSEAIQTRDRVLDYLRKVDVDEQPFKRVWDMVQFARKRGKTNSELDLDPATIQTGQSLQARSLLLKCELVIFLDFLTIFGSRLRDVNLERNREECLKLAAAAKDTHRPLVEVQGHLFFVQLCVAERMYCSRLGDAEILSQKAREHLGIAKHLCNEYPGSTTHAAGDLETAEEMVESSSFVTRVRDDEWRAVMAAMADEFRGSGHWYTCVNGHPFTVGECGMPMELARCPACRAPVGGQNHLAAEGVSHAGDLERRFGSMQV